MKPAFTCCRLLAQKQLTVGLIITIIQGSFKQGVRSKTVAQQKESLRTTWPERVLTIIMTGAQFRTYSSFTKILQVTVGGGEAQTLTYLYWLATLYLACLKSLTVQIKGWMTLVLMSLGTLKKSSFQFPSLMAASSIELKGPRENIFKLDWETIDLMTFWAAYGPLIASSSSSFIRPAVILLQLTVMTMMEPQVTESIQTGGLLGPHHDGVLESKTLRVRLGEQKVLRGVLSRFGQNDCITALKVPRGLVNKKIIFF